MDLDLYSKFYLLLVATTVFDSCRKEIAQSHAAEEERHAIGLLLMSLVAFVAMLVHHTASMWMWSYGQFTAMSGCHLSVGQLSMGKLAAGDSNGKV